MNAASEPPVDPDDSVPRVDPVDSGRSGTSSAGLAAATLRALRAGNRDEPPAAGPDETAADVGTEEPVVKADQDESVDEVDEVDVVEDQPVVEADTVDAADTVEAAEPEPVSLRKPASANRKAALRLPTYNADTDAEADDAADVDAADADADADADDDAVSDAGDAASPRLSLITIACAVLAVAALVFAIVAGVSWWHAGHSQQRRIGIARDQVDADARLAITTVNTSDYRHPSAALDNWLGASTGSLHSQFSQSRTTAVKLLAQAKMVTKASVLDAAVTDLNLSKGTATVIASVNVTRTPATGSVSTVRNRFKASMTRTGNSWKLSNLAVVAVSLS